MTDNVNDSGPDEIMVRSPKAAGEDDVEGHTRILGKDGQPDGSAPKPKFDSGEDEDVEGHGRILPRDAGPEGAGSRKMPTFDGCTYRA